MKKYHHLVPKVYFTPWQKNKGTLKIKEKADNTITEKNKDNVFGIKYYHSIIAGMPICTQDDADFIFHPLKGLNVCYNGEYITDTRRMGEVFYDFLNWTITEHGDSIISKRKHNKIYNDIKQRKINEIEDLWSTKYENKWDGKRELIEQKINGITSSCTIDAFQKGFLTKFMVSLDWRSIAKSDVFNDAFNDVNSKIHLDKIAIPKDDRDLPLFKTGYDYMQHCILLKYFRDFLHDKGEMFEYAKKCIKELSLCFLIAPQNKRFFTSDNPSFHIKENNHSGIIGIFPISPQICILQIFSQEKDKYLVQMLSEKQVDTYNKYIEENASDLIVL